MNILYLPGYRYPASLKEPITSGDLRYSFTLSRALARMGHSVTVISRKNPDDQNIATLDGVTIIRYTSELQRIFSTSFDISLHRRRLFKEYCSQADLIICNSPLSLEHTIRLTSPIIYIASGLEDTKNYKLSVKEVFGFLAIKLLRDPLKRLTWRRAKYVNTTAWYEEATLKKWGIPKDKIGTVSSSVDLKRYTPIHKNPSELRKRLGYAFDDKIILHISRFTPAKGIVETVKAFGSLSNVKARLLIIGVNHSHDSTYHQRVIESISVSPRKQDIKILENVNEAELPHYYAMSDVTSVFSKGYDPLPTVIIESMACGTPVVSTYYKTREQFITEKVSGLYVAELDQNDWVEKLSEILDNKQLRQSLSTKGLQVVTEQFDAMNIAKEYVRMVENE